MSDIFFPPSVPANDAIARMLADRIDACRLSLGMAVGITEAKRRHYIAHGSQDAACSRPINEHTLFEIGSVTKLFTSLLLADMVVRREAERDEPVAKLLPSGVRVPERNGRQITLVDLARHLSGLPRLPTNLTPNDPADPYAHYTAQHLYDFLAHDEMPRTPGDAVEYSNLGAGLLGHALSLRAGMEYEALVRARILAPLGMDSTVIIVPPALTPRMAQGHDANLDPVPDWHLGILAGAGALRSCVSDLLVFLEMLTDHEASPLGPAAALLVAPRDQGGLDVGWSQTDGSVVLEHDGGTGGFRSHVSCVAQWRRGVVVLSNSATGVGDLGTHLRDTRWGMLWYRREVMVDPACFACLVGRYRLKPGIIMEVTASDGRLFVQLTGQASFRVFPASEWHFFYKIVGAQITFEPGVNGHAARLILHQNSIDRIAERMADGDDAPGRS